MRCTNCDAVIPSDAGACPQCGVFARTLPSTQAKRKKRTWILTLLFLAVAAAGATYYFTTWRPLRKPVRQAPVVPRQTGPVTSERGAIIRLQQSFSIPRDCVVIIGKGYRENAYDLTAFNRCDNTRLGRWRVDPKSGAVSRRHD